MTTLIGVPAMSSDTLCDIFPLVEEAFDEMRCESVRRCPHGGEIAGLVIWHDCLERLLCSNHYQRFVTIKLPSLRREFGGTGMRCRQCRRFFKVESFVRAVPL